MPNAPKPLTSEQQILVNAVKVTHETLLLARRLRGSEVDARLAEARIQHAREWDKIEAQIRIDIDREIAQHEAAEDEALIAAYLNGVPVRRIALDGWGNRLDGNVHAKLRDLRRDGRVGNRVGYQGGEDATTNLDDGVVFPETVKIDGILNEALEVAEITFSSGDTLELVPGSPEYNAESVIVTLDPRDPYRKRIEKNARPGTPHRYATTATLYRHPATNELTVLESLEEGDTYWDHPVARWVKDHPAEAEVGFEQIISA